MIFNATLSGWQRQNGVDAEGIPAYAPVEGSWPCCSELATARYVTNPAGRAIPVDRIVRTDATLTIRAGDKISLDGTEYLVLSAGLQPGALQHLRLDLGSAA